MGTVTAGTAGSANGITAYTAILLMYLLNARWQMTFPPEVAVAFQGFVSYWMTLLLQKEKLPLTGDTVMTPAKAGLLLALALGAPLVLQACTSTGTLTPAAQNVLTVACQADKAAPVVVQGAGVLVTIVDPATVGVVAAANAADQLAHPVVQAACAAALPGSTPAAVTVTPVAPAS